MSYKVTSSLVVVLGMTMLSAGTAPARAQMAEVKEKPPLYTYVADWTIPRAKWTEMEKLFGGGNKVVEKAFSSGTLVGYGTDVALVHTADGATHDNWWTSMSIAGVLDVLDELVKAGTAPVLSSATKHSDSIYVSRYYNWHSGTRHGAYTRSSSYKLKADAPDDSVDTFAKGFIVPLLEKLLADGSLLEYEIDEEAVHTQAPGTFWIVTISPNSAGQDKIDAGLRAALAASPFAGSAFGAVVDFTGHRDELARTEATYK